jgi:demethylmenaquinone methyltransferase/2-methoxy-6-polyprenyl-1,4-benzoquinol methylase
VNDVGTGAGAASGETAPGHEVRQPGRDPERIEALFDDIVPRYDLMNRLMTAGLDRGWRAAAAAQASPPPAGPVLDACCGTGDLLLSLRERYPDSPLTGLDFSAAMLTRAREKLERAGVRVSTDSGADAGAGMVTGGAGTDASAAAAMSVRLVRGDLLELPFDDRSFAAVTVGWGVRNVADLERGLSELRRVTRPGGRVVVLEATQPRGAAGRAFHAVWFARVVPLLGRVVAGKREAYAYLPDSVRSFPDAQALADRMAAAGLERVRFRRFGLGAMALHVGTVPE